MGTTAAGHVGRVALMSIHPKYASQILAGAKRVEFRKRPIAPDVTHVLVYATAPVSAIVGAFAVNEQVTLAPQMLWRRFRHVAGIGWADFTAYYTGRQSGTGIAVGDVLVADEPMCLQSRLGLFRPPQSFQYLPTETGRTLLGEMQSVNRYSTA